MRTKPIDDVLAAGEQTGLRRRLGSLDLIGIGIGIVIGTGLFTLTGIEAREHAGPAISVSAFGIAGVLTAAAVVFFAYTGFEAVANLGEETRRPARDMPRGVLGTLALATVLYIGVSFVVVGMVDYRSIDPGAPISDAFRTAGAPWAAVLVSPWR
jgi:amino acid transporter